MYEINRFKLLSQALVHFVIDRASLFTDHRISGLTSRAKYKTFQNNSRAYMWQFSYRFHFFFFDVMVINAWSWYFVELLSRFVCQLTISFHTFLGMTFHVIGPRRNTMILRAWYFFSSTRGNSRFKHGSVIVSNIFAYFTFFCTSQVFMIKERCWLSQINSLFCTFHIGSTFCFFPANLMSST